MRSSHLVVLGIVLLGVASGVAWDISGQHAVTVAPTSAPHTPSTSPIQPAIVASESPPASRSSHPRENSTGTTKSAVREGSIRAPRASSPIPAPAHTSAPSPAALGRDHASRIGTASSFPSPSQSSSADPGSFHSSAPARPAGDTLTIGQQTVTIQAYERTPEGNALDIGVSPAATTNRPIAAGGFTLEEEQFRAKWGWVAFDQVQRAVRYNSTAN